MYMSSDLMINCPYLQFEIMDSHYIHFCRMKCFVYGKLRPLTICFVSGLRLKNPVSCSPGSSHPMTNSGSPHLLLYLQNHHPHASTSTNSVCFTRSMKFADINCPEQSRHIRSRTSPLLQQSSHHVKWLLPLAHQKMTKEAVTVYCCVRNRQNTWLDSVNILLSISDLVQNVQKGYLWNYKSCQCGISPHCADWCGLQLCQISHSCELSSCCKCIKILH